MEKETSTEKVLIEIEEPCVMDLVDPDEREQLRKWIIERIRPDVADLFASETERILKEKYNLSSEDALNVLSRRNSGVSSYSE